MNTAAIVLAAGAGVRMKSKQPKVLHKILEKPLIFWVIDALHDAGISDIVSVVGHEREQVAPLIENTTKVVVQPEQNGTAGAVRACSESFANFSGSIVVLTGDSPLITAETIKHLIDEREKTNAAIVMLTMMLDDPFGYGRVVRDESGAVKAIVEEKDTTPEQAAIHECNSGFYCFDAKVLFEAVEQVENNNTQGELYLTDVIGICSNASYDVRACIANDPTECLGVNSRAQLAEAGIAMQRRINDRHMAAGVTMWDPSQVWIGSDVAISSDVEILPQTYIFGATGIGKNCVIGPNTRITDTHIGRGCTLEETIAHEVTIDNNVTCGPRAYLRPGTHLCDNSKVGTHVEIKKSTVGKRSKVPHLSYIGDATIGEDVNIGAGSITCNYDGEKKYQTIIGDGAFIGSDTMMVAPVEIGAHAAVGAGSCITENVSEGALGLGRARQTEIADWVAKHEEKKKSEKAEIENLEDNK